jgi:hypothetical protein
MGLDTAPLHLLGRSASGVRSRNQGTDTRAGYKVDRNLLLFQELEDTDVGDAAGETTAKGQTDSRPFTAPGIREGAKALDGP